MSHEAESQYIPLEEQTEEERQEWIREQGRTLYKIFSRGGSAWVGPLLGGHNRKSEEFVVENVRDVARLAMRQLARTDDEIREDHALIGYDPGVISKITPRNDVITLISGMSEAAKEYGDANTIRLVRNVIEWSKNPNKKNAPENASSGMSLPDIATTHLQQGGTVVILSGEMIRTRDIIGGFPLHGIKPVA